MDGVVGVDGVVEVVGGVGVVGVVGVVGLVGLVWRKKLNVTPKEKKENNNFCTTRPALLVKIKALTYSTQVKFHLVQVKKLAVIALVNISDIKSANKKHETASMK